MTHVSSSSYDTCILLLICLQHDDVPKGMDYIIASHKRGRTSTVIINNNDDQ